MPYTKYVWVAGVSEFEILHMNHLETIYDEVHTIILKSADEIVNNSTALQNDDELLVAVGANEIWFIKFFIMAISSAVADFKEQWVLPAGGAFNGIEGGDFGPLASNGVWPALYDITTQKAIAFGGANLVYWGEGIYVGAAAAGNVQWQWSQNTAEVSDTKVLENSFVIAKKLA